MIVLRKDNSEGARINYISLVLLRKNNKLDKEIKREKYEIKIFWWNKIILLTLTKRACTLRERFCHFK